MLSAGIGRLMKYIAFACPFVTWHVLQMNNREKQAQ
jgi:hypothetical protein